MKSYNFQYNKSFDGEVVDVPVGDVSCLDQISMNVLVRDVPEFAVPFIRQEIDNQVWLEYKVSRFIPLRYRIETYFNQLSDYVNLGLSLIAPFVNCSNWLTDYHYFCIDPEYVYLDRNTNKVSYILIPDTEYAATDEEIVEFFRAVLEKPVLTGGEAAAFQNRIYRCFQQNSANIEVLYSMFNEEKQNLPVNAHQQTINRTVQRAGYQDDNSGRTASLYGQNINQEPGHPAGSYGSSQVQNDAAAAVSQGQSAGGYPVPGGVQPSSAQPVPLQQEPVHQPVPKKKGGLFHRESGAKVTRDEKKRQKQQEKLAKKQEKEDLKREKEAEKLRKKNEKIKGGKTRARVSGKSVTDSGSNAVEGLFGKNSRQAPVSSEPGTGIYKREVNSGHTGTGAPAAGQQIRQEPQPATAYRADGYTGTAPGNIQGNPVYHEPVEPEVRRVPKPTLVPAQSYDDESDETEIDDNMGSVAVSGASYLRLVKAPFAGAPEMISLEFNKDHISIGRQAKDAPVCDVTFPKEFRRIGRQHAWIVRGNDRQYYLIDLGSPNGTFLNGTQLTPNVSYRIDNGADISFTMGDQAVFYRAEING